MILRRLTDHVKDQNWFAVGVDFVIVVIGVFIGIRDELTRALQQAGVAWIDPMTVAAAAEVARNHPGLLAAMKNFWSFNEYHLRTLRAVRGLATELKATAEREAAP
jgi:hypothetical protein